MNKKGIDKTCVISLALLIAGCVGSSDSDSGSDSGSTGNGGFNDGSLSSPSSLTGANGGADGFIWVARNSAMFNMDTGTTTYVSSNRGAWPRADGLEFITLADSSRFIDDPFCGGEKTFQDSVTIRDTVTGMAVGGFDIVEKIRGVPRLSPDGLTIAGHWVNDSICLNNNTTLTVWDRNGQELTYGAPEIGDFDWLPDNRLVFEIDGDIAVETERNTFRYQRIARLGNIPGSPRNFDVSPDGTSIVFEMSVGGSSFLTTVNYRVSSVWRINVDGTGLERIVDSNRENPDGETYVNSPVYSPDGSSVLVTENWISGPLIAPVQNSNSDDTQFPFLPGVNYEPAMGSGGLSEIIPLADLPAILPPAVWNEAHIKPVFERDDDDATLEFAALWPIEGRRWTNAIPEAATEIGSMPAQNGQINRGFTGNLYRRDDGDIQRLNLATGEQTTVVEKPSDETPLMLAVSEDESRIVMVTSDGSDRSLRVYNDDGELLKNFDLQSRSYYLRPESAPRFFPGSNSLVAWAYDDDNFGQAVVVFNIETGSFFERTDVDYVDIVDWFPNGDLLMVDGAKFYRLGISADAGGFNPPVLIANVHERVDELRIHPDGSQIIYRGGEQIMLLNVADGTRRRLTAWTENHEGDPVFSPDGRFVLFKKYGSFDFGWPWIMARDGSNVRIRDEESIGNASVMRVGEGTDLDWRTTRGDVLWRGGN